MASGCGGSDIISDLGRTETLLGSAWVGGLDSFLDFETIDTNGSTWILGGATSGVDTTTSAEEGSGCFLTCPFISPDGGELVVVTGDVVVGVVAEEATIEVASTLLRDVRETG